MTGPKRWAATLLIAAAPLALASCNETKQAAAPPARPPQEVSVVTVRPQSVAITAELPGRITPYLVAEVRPQVAGIIRERVFKEGSEVAQGATLYQIDSASYKAAYDSASAGLSRAQAAVPTAQAQLERYQVLARSSAVTEAQIEQATAALAQARADVAAAQANLAAAKINLDYTKITAPIPGLIGKSAMTVGGLVTANQTLALATIRQLDPIYVDLTQSSTSLLRFRRALQTGQLRGELTSVPVRLTLEDGSNYDKIGKLEFVDVSIDESTSTFTVRAVFPNPDRLLLPGMYVRAIVEEGVADGSFLLPQRGVTRNAKGEATAMFVSKDNKVEQRVVGARRTIGSSWLVDKGVADGDKLIVEGTLKVRPSQDVKPIEVVVDPNTGEIRQASGALGPARTADSEPAKQ